MTTGTPPAPGAASCTARPWWGKRIESAYQSYWVYQHLGNLSPAELAVDETWGKVREQGDAAPVLADLAHRADQRAPGVRWSFARTFSTTDGTAPGQRHGGATGGKVRVVMLDSRSRRVVDGTRLMTDEGEWRWLTEAVAGDWAHVVIATSVPPLLPRGIHTLEAWTERICGGAWGRRAVRFGERLRQAVDLEHWPSFGASFAQLELLLTELATGRHSPGGEPGHGDDHLWRHSPQLPGRRRPPASRQPSHGSRLSRAQPREQAPSTKRSAHRSTRPSRRRCASLKDWQAPGPAA